MSRILSVAAASAMAIGIATAALAQQPSYTDRYSSSDRYATSSDRDANETARGTTGWKRQETQRTTPDRATSTGNLRHFASESEAKANCRGDTVVWVNTKSHVYHFAGNPAYGTTKRGGYMCQADADRSGSFRAARSEKPVRGFSGGSMMPQDRYNYGR